MQEFTINDFSDIQVFQKRFDIPFTVSISRFMQDVLNAFFEEDEESVRFYLSQEILPPTYIKNPCVWGNVLRPKVNYPFVKSYRKNGKTIVEASNLELQVAPFYTTLRQKLQSTKELIVLISDLPQSFQINPWTLQWRLKKLFATLQMQIDRQDLTITFTHNEKIK